MHLTQLGAITVIQIRTTTSGQVPNRQRQLTVHPKIIGVTKTTCEVTRKSRFNIKYVLLDGGENWVYFICSIVSLTNYDPISE